MYKIKYGSPQCVHELRHQSQRNACLWGSVLTNFFPKSKEKTYSMKFSHCQVFQGIYEISISIWMFILICLKLNHCQNTCKNHFFLIPFFFFWQRMKGLQSNPILSVILPLTHHDHTVPNDYSPPTRWQFISTQLWCFCPWRTQLTSVLLIRAFPDLPCTIHTCSCYTQPIPLYFLLDCHILRS